MDDRLHPALRRLLEGEGWDRLSPAQEASIDAMLARRHVMLIAPTGHGKTEAAILPILHHLLTERDRTGPWPTGFKAVYITPLRALNRDLLRRLEAWCGELGLRIGVRHGDTTPAERGRQARSPPDLLITTPESLQLLLYGDTLRRHLATVRFVVIDEVHDLASSERGAQLTVALERLEEAIAQPDSVREARARERPCPAAPHAGRDRFQRIGLSATVVDGHAVARFMAGARPVDVLRVDVDKERRLQVVSAAVRSGDAAVAARLALPPGAAAQLRRVRELVMAHERVLVFHNTRDGAELLTSRSAIVDEEEGRRPIMGLHHGSLSAEHRIATEEAFRDGHVRGLVATSSLELGIDVGAIDHVVQVQSPRSVARLVQRLGRAGHRIGAVSEGTLVSGGPEDHLECVAVARMAQRGSLEPLRIREAPLVVLANQLVALSNEYAGLEPRWCYDVIRRAGPFMELDEGLFQACWDTLLDVHTVYEAEHAPGRIGRSGRGRRHFLEHISLIPDETKYRLLDESTKRVVGTVDDAFVAAGMQPGQRVVVAGRSWQVLEVDVEAQRVRIAPSRDLGAIPHWAGQQLPVSRELAREVARLRGALARGEEDMPDAAGPIHEHVRLGLAVPTDKRVTLDQGRGAVVAGVALGTRGNEALARVTAALIHQRSGASCGFDADAYRIHFDVPGGVGAAQVEEAWRGIDPGTIDLLLGMVIKDQPVVRHHLVHVAKHFGALPGRLDPNRFTKAKMEALWDRLALQEETLSRLLHDRFDIDAAAAFLRDLDTGAVEVVHQAMGPLSRIARDEVRSMVAPLRDDKLLEEVRRRIEASDVMLVCTNCRSRLDMTVAGVPRRVRCRRCGHTAVACLRPWHADQLHLLAKDDSRLSAQERQERRRWLRNGRIMADFGHVAACCLAARGVGPDVAARILQKCGDPDNPMFWRLILEAELVFARTSAFWGPKAKK